MSDQWIPGQVRIARLRGAAGAHQRKQCVREHLVRLLRAAARTVENRPPVGECGLVVTGPGAIDAPFVAFARFAVGHAVARRDHRGLEQARSLLVLAQFPSQIRAQREHRTGTVSVLAITVFELIEPPIGCRKRHRGVADQSRRHPLQIPVHRRRDGAEFGRKVIVDPQQSGVDDRSQIPFAPLRVRLGQLQQHRPLQGPVRPYLSGRGEHLQSLRSPAPVRQRTTERQCAADLCRVHLTPPLPVSYHPHATSTSLRRGPPTEPCVAQSRNSPKARLTSRVSAGRSGR